MHEASPTHPHQPHTEHDGTALVPDVNEFAKFGTPEATQDRLHVEGDSVAAIKQAALHAFAEHGYDGTTVRQIAARAGMSTAGIYHHFAAKNDILFEIISVSLEHMVRSTERAIAAAAPDPLTQLDAAVRAHVRYHIEYQLEAFVGLTELRSFQGDRLEKIAGLRRRHQRIFDDLVRKLQAEGYEVIYADEVSRAIVTMGMSVAHWYRRGGRLSPEEMLERYARLAAVLVGARHGEQTARRTQAKQGARQ